MAHVIAIRSESASLLQTGLLSNKSLLGAVALTILPQLGIVYLPFIQSIFDTVASDFPGCLFVECASG